MAYHTTNLTTRPKTSNTNVASYSDPFTGESFILPTSAHNTQAKINYDRQKAVRKRTSDLIELDPQTAEAMLLNIGGAWEEGQLREQFRDIRKTGNEAERKKAAQKARTKAIDNLYEQAKNVYKNEDGFLAHMERVGLRRLIGEAYDSHEPTQKKFFTLAEPHEKKFFDTKRIGIEDGMKLHKELDKIRGELENDEAQLSNEIKRRSDPKVDWSDEDEAKIQDLKKSVVERQEFVRLGDKELGKGIPKSMYELGKRTKKVINAKSKVNKKTGKEELSWYQQFKSFFSGDSSTADLPPLKPRNGSPEKIQLTNEVTRLTKERDALKNIPKGKLTDDALQQAVEGSLEPEWEQERGQGEVGTYHALPPEKPLVIEQGAKYKFEETPNLKATNKWDTSQDTIPFERGTSPQSRINLDGTSAQEVTTEPTKQAQKIEPFTAEASESMPMLSDSGGGEVFNQVVAEKETGMGFLDVVKSIKRIAVEESPEVAQEVLDGIKGFTNYVVKTATSRDYQRSIIGLSPDEDTPDPNQGTPTPSGDGTGFFKGMNMMAGSGYESVAPAVKEKFNWAKEKLKGLTGGFLDWQRRDPSSTGRPSGFSGSREEQFLTPNKKEFNANVLAGDTLSGIEQAYKKGSKIEGMKSRYFPALKRTEGGTEHDSSARGDFALMPRYMTRTPYFENKYGVMEELKKQGKYKISMDKFSQDLDNPVINARVAAEFTYINDQALKNNLVTGGWKGMNSGTQERQDWEDLLSATHYLGQTKMESILAELFESDPKKGRGVTMSTLMDYFKNSSDPLVNIAHSHVERFRGYRKEKRKRGK